MNGYPGRILALDLMLVVAFANFGPKSEAQAIAPGQGMLQSGMQPRFSQSGDWGEVVTVTPKWLVVQNQQGQQFPVSLDAVNQFMLRWPIDPSQITPGALVETTGIDLGTNQIRTDHVDVFEGSARGMVQPLVQQVIGFGRRPTAFDLQNRNTYGVFIPLLPGEDKMPNRLHVVGPIAGYNPLRLAVAGNNAVSVFPLDTGLSFFQVTPGSSSFLREGDLVYVVPSDMTPKSLILSEMVGYKRMPIGEFVP